MNVWKTVTALCLAGGLAMGCWCSGGLPLREEDASAADSTSDDWLHAEGNKLYDMDGNEVWLTGCNWFGFNVGSQVFDGVWSQNMHAMLTQIADHGFNFLRVPMSTQILLQWKNGDPDPAAPKVNGTSNPELIGMDSWQLWNQAMEWCKELGIKVMIDIHSAETHAAGHTFALWFNEKYSTEDLYDSLSWFADYYKNDDTLLAIDIKNEPHGTADTPDNMAKWDDSEDVNNWKYVAETAGKRILEKNPNLLIVIEGVEVYPKEGYDWTAPKIEWTTMTTFYEGTWWGANLRGVAKDPVNLGSEKANAQIVYSPHDYGPLVFKQTWFYEGFTQETLMKDCWHDNWAYIYEDGIAPLLIGEWGGFMDGGPNEQWMVYLRDYIRDNHIHHTFWCFNENSGDTGGLVKENFGEWDEEKYALVKPTLWQTENGAFIGLDHQVPLGSNGISLGDYANGEVGMTTPVGGTTLPVVQDPVRGDANRDGKLNVLDVLMLKQHFISHATVTAEEWEEADFNQNGKIELADMIDLGYFILNKTVNTD